MHIHRQFRVTNQPTPSLHVFREWEETGVPSLYAFYSKNIFCIKKDFQLTTQTLREVQLIFSSLSLSHFLSEPEAPAILALQEVSQTLWTQQKHYLGWIRNEPNLITPKSDYRPC